MYERKRVIDINQSPWIYENGTMIYKFISEFNLKRFKAAIENNRKKMAFDLSSRYNLNINIHDFFDVVLYLQIEKFGCYIQIKGGELLQCRDQIKLYGQITK